MPDTWSFGLTGYPLGHSISPILHQSALDQAGLFGCYWLFPINPEKDGDKNLAELLKRLRIGQLHGLNVTIPHKQRVLSLVDDLTPSAAAIGASNTLYMDANSRLIGDNTDAPGFWDDVNHLPLKGEKNALILGAGGAARAVVYALLTHGWNIHITDIFEEQTQSLCSHFAAQKLDSGSLQGIEFSPKSIGSAAENASLIVNTTPVGMHPKVEESPWPEGVPFPKGACLYDVVYNPMETRLMQQAKAAGLPCRCGLGMLVGQAALAFERWTGFSPDRNLMLEAALQEKRSDS